MIRPAALPLALAAALALSAALAMPAAAQEAAEAPAEAPEAQAPEAQAPAAAVEELLPTGEPVAGAAPAQAAAQGPEIYVREEHGDWEVRCLRAPEGQEDPCQLFQRLEDQNGNPTADVNVFDLPDGGEIVAGATVLTPLQTLLTAQVTMSVDGGEPRRYPFAFCDPAGCYARLGFTAGDVARLRAGANAEIVVVPAQAPDQQANLTMSLMGFTAGYAAVSVD
jgi:invasion protein IalB